MDWVLYLIHSIALLKPEELEAYESDMRRCLDACAPTEHLVWGTDANASLGIRSRSDGSSDADQDRVLGYHGVSHVNEAGRKLHILLGLHGLCVPTTFFQKTPMRNRSSAHDTWHNMGNKRAYQLDHFLFAGRICAVLWMRDR